MMMKTLPDKALVEMPRKFHFYIKVRPTRSALVLAKNPWPCVVNCTHGNVMKDLCRKLERS